MIATKNTIRESLIVSSQLLGTMAESETLCAAVFQAATICVNALKKGNKILLCGNGGSAADAQHWAGELVSRFAYDRPGLAAVALTTDSSIMSAIGNDYGYDKVFSRQVESIGSAGDVLLAISTSGNSNNVILALEAARDRQLSTVGFMGSHKGKMAALCDVCLHVPSTCTPRVQEGHEALGHIICGLIETIIFPKEVAS